MNALPFVVLILGLWLGLTSCNQLCGTGSQCPPTSQCTLPAGAALSNASLYYCDDGFFAGCEDCSRDNATNGEICQVLAGSTGTVGGTCACQEALGFQQNPTVGFYKCDNKNTGSCQCKPPFVCINDKCQCPAGSVYYVPPGASTQFETCVIVDSGTKCENDTSCVNFPGSQCLFNICQCPPGYYLSLDTNPASCAPNPPPPPAFCLMAGDPHVTSFDGLGFSPQERCDYVASRSIPGAPFQYEVHVRTGECGIAPNVFPAVSCVKGVAIRYGSSGVIEFNMTGAWFNGTLITSFPFTGYPGVTILNDNGQVGFYSAVLGPNNEIQVDFSPYTLAIYAKPSFSQLVEGWCGNFNNSFFDDYAARNGTQLPLVPFFRSWTVLPNVDPILFRNPNSEFCVSPNGFKRNVPSTRNIFLDPCNGNVTAFAEAQLRCNPKVLIESIPADIQQGCVKASNRINLQYLSASCIFDYCNAPGIDFRSFFLKTLVNLCKFVTSPSSPTPSKTPSATSGTLPATPPVGTTTTTPIVRKTCPPCPQGAACDPTAAELVCKCVPPAQPVFFGTDFKCEARNTAPVGCTSNQQCEKILGQGSFCDTTATPPKCICGAGFFFDSITKTCKPSTVTIPVVNPALCYGTGDPHFLSFDGLWYDHQERCDYVLAKATNPIPFEVQIRTGECRTGPSSSSSFPQVSCARGIAMKFGNERLVFELDVGVSKDGVNVTSFPYTFLSGQVVVTQLGQNSWEANYTTANILVSYQTFFASIKVYPNYLNNTVGLCGNYNGLLTDDFTGQNGTLWSVPNPFARSWTVPAYPNAANLFNNANPEVCSSPNGFKRASSSIFEDPCQGNVTLLTRAFQACNFTDLLNSPVIDKNKCQQAFDFGYVTPMCIFDYCQSGVDLGELLANVTQQSIIGLCTLAQTLTADSISTAPVATQPVASTVPTSVATTPVGQPTPTSTSQVSGSATLTALGVLALIVSLALVI